MRFSLEAVQADHGDSLLVHWGTASAPRVMAIDGGPSPTYQDTLRDRLLKLASSRAAGKLDIELLMISHIDDDHINGVQRLLNDVAGGHLPEVTIGKFWFNSFDDLAQSSDDGDFVALGRRGVPVAGSLRRRLTGRAKSIAASVPQGRSVSRLAVKLGLDGNRPFNGLVVRPQRSAKTVPIDARLSLTVLGPSKERVDQLRTMWRQAASLGAAGAAPLAYIDDSIPNLSSIIVLAKVGAKTMLLTGDARGDDIIAGLRAAGMTAPRIRVNILKVPHHGSDRNVETDFFRTVIADHYVISGNGKYHNPELATFAMLTEARRGEQFTVHLTNRETRIVQWFAHNRTRTDRYKIEYRRTNQPSIRVDLADAVTE